MSNLKHTTDRYFLTRAQSVAIIGFLSGEFTSRQLGPKLGVSHQGAINAVATICRQWYRAGYIRLHPVIDVPPRKHKDHVEKK